MDAVTTGCPPAKSRALSLSPITITLIKTRISLLHFYPPTITTETTIYQLYLDVASTISSIEDRNEIRYKPTKLRIKTNTRPNPLTPILTKQKLGSYPTDQSLIRSIRQLYVNPKNPQSTDTTHQPVCLPACLLLMCHAYKLAI